MTHSSKRVQSAVDGVCREQGGTTYDGESKEPIPSHDHAGGGDHGHNSAEYGGVKGDMYPGGSGGGPSPGTGR